MTSSTTRVKAFSPEIHYDMLYLDGSRAEMVSMCELLPKHNTDHSPLSRHTVVYVRGSRTLDVTLTTPISFFPSKLSAGPALIVDQDNVDLGDAWWRSPNGSGPYELLVWQPEELIVLGRAATASWLPGGPARVQFHQLDVGEDLLLYENDELDLVFIGAADLDGSGTRMSRAAGSCSARRTWRSSTSGSTRRWHRSTTCTCGGALALATDRGFINEALLGGTQREAKGVIPPGLPGHRPDFEGLAFDVEAARAELAKSSYGSAEALPTHYPGSAGRQPFGQSVPRNRRRPVADRVGRRRAYRVALVR